MPAKGSRNGVSRRPPNHQAGIKPEPTTKVRGDPWQSVSALQLGLQPRSFGELHAERMYLLEMLQQHDRRAFDLFMKVPLVEGNICWAENLEDRKQAKKHRGWLRHRIVDTVEEEKKILARLSELHVEIQCRERWSRVEKEREMINLTQPQHVPEYPGLPAPSSIPRDLQTYPLPPELPITPHAYNMPSCAQGVYPQPNWEYQTPTHGQSIFENNPGPEAAELDATPIDVTPGSGSHDRSQSLEVIPESKPTKRQSMPSLSRAWSGQGGENSKDHT
ncbi:hypothetical protein F4781DRAFT_392331 [Annulohypoxylon bovei var. microspora]|nr:hypothetical protein F4781DRAFT_392331 [Annulohypoxylon bovei var. microspora]